MNLALPRIPSLPVTCPLQDKALSIDLHLPLFCIGPIHLSPSNFLTLSPPLVYCLPWLSSQPLVAALRCNGQTIARHSMSSSVTLTTYGLQQCTDSFISFQGKFCLYIFWSGNAVITEEFIHCNGLKNFV